MLSRQVRTGAYVAAAWLALIALNLISSGKYVDVAVRDLAMAVGAWTLARLAELHEPAKAAPPVEAAHPGSHGMAR